MVVQNKEPLLILARAACPAGYGVTPEILFYESGAREESGCGARTRYSGRVNRLRGFRVKPPKQLPLANMAARAPSAQPPPMDRPGSISDRQLSRSQTPAANEEGERGAAGLGSWARGPMEMRHVGGRGGRTPMGSSCVCPGPLGGAPRRVRFIRAAAAAAAATAEEDVGYARAGGSAGPERAA